MKMEKRIFRGKNLPQSLRANVAYLNAVCDRTYGRFDIYHVTYHMSLNRIATHCPEQKSLFGM